MSDTTKNTNSAEPVRLGKGTSAGTTPAVPHPRTITLATAAIGAVIVLSIVEVASLFGFTSEFSKLLADNNAKAKKPKSPYGPTEIAHDLHQFRISQVVQTVVVSLALTFLILAIRRVKSASVGRWALIIVMVLTNGPAALIPVKGLPTLPAAVRMFIGAASLATIILLILPESSRYFRACKAAMTPEGAPPRAGLRDLFAPRRAAGATKPAPAAAPTATQADKPPAPRSKAKTRNDEAAVAKGAELARNRAKASKSRRTEV